MTLSVFYVQYLDRLLGHDVLFYRTMARDEMHAINNFLNSKIPYTYIYSALTEEVYNAFQFI